MVGYVDFKRFPPALPADVPRVKPNGLPTDQSLDWEAAQASALGLATSTLNERLVEITDEFGKSSASFSQRIEALADADSAIVQQITEFRAEVGDDFSTVNQTITAETNARGALAQEVTAFKTAYNDNKASVDQRITSQTDAQGALAEQVTGFKAEFNQSKAAVQQQITAEATERGALAGRVDTAETHIGENAASISTFQNSLDGVSVQYGVIGSINQQSGGYVVTGVRRLDGSVSFGMELALSSFRLNDPNLPAGSQQVFDYSTALGAFVFNIPVKITSGLLGPGTVSTRKAVSIPADTVIAAGIASQYDVHLYGFDITAQFDVAKQLDIEARCQVYLTDAGTGSYVRNFRIAVINANTGVIIESLVLYRDVAANVDPLPDEKILRMFVSLQAGMPYVFRYVFDYFGFDPSTLFRFKKASIKYLAVTETPE